jgi:hypothetical protein
MEDVGFHAIDKLGGVGHIGAPLHQLAQPCDFLVEAFVMLALFFILPVCCNPTLGDLVHFARANLNLHGASAAFGEDSRVQRAIHVIFGIGNVVVKLAGDGAIVGVDNAYAWGVL